jgi:outer membrane protein insertion porin family
MTGSSLDSLAANSSANSSRNDKQLAIDLGAFTTRVDAVHIDGIGRTKDDVLGPMVKQLFEAKNFEEVVVKAHTVRRHLEQLGAFKSIGVFIDTSSGDNATKDGLEVTYSVTENRRVVGGVNTSIGNNNDGSVILQLKCPNVFGRGLSAN